jgi:hypothetical protein
MDILMALPSNIVADNIYPQAVRIIKDPNHLIEAMDFYCDSSNHCTDSVTAILWAGGTWNQSESFWVYSMHTPETLSW